MTTMAMMRWAATAGFGTLLVACGGGGGSNGDFGGFPAYTVAELPFTVDGSEPELNLAFPDAVLTAALTAAAAANAIVARSLGSLDIGSNPPGRGVLPCVAGTVQETVAVDAPSGQRTVTQASSQCFDVNAGSVQNGAVQLAYLRPSAGLASGTLSFGTSPASYTFSLPEAGSSDYNFRQGRGPVRFQGEFDGSPTASQANGFALIVGRGPLSTTGAAFSPGRQIEVLLGAPGIDYNVAVSGSGVTQNVTTNGRLFFRGSNSSVLSVCSFAASVDVATSTALVVSVGNGSITGGMMSLSTSAGSATVSFDASGNAVVTPTSGVPQSYPASVVANYCGIF